MVFENHKFHQYEDKAVTLLKLIRNKNFDRQVLRSSPEKIIKLRNHIEEIAIQLSGYRNSHPMTLNQIKTQYGSVVQYYEENPCSEPMEACITESCYERNPDCFKRKLLSQINVLDDILSTLLPEETEKNDLTRGGNNKILIIDDDVHQRKLLMFKLVKDGYQILSAESGLEGLQILEKNPVRLIVCDVMMPGMDGFVFLKKVKMNPKVNHVPVILLTAVNDENSVVKGLELGAEDYITKPFSPTELSTRIKNILKKDKINA